MFLPIFSMMFYPIDKWYLFLIVPAMILSMYAQFKVKSTFAKYSEIGNERQITGVAVANEILSANGITNVSVEPVRGSLTDHYSPKEQVLRLSETVHSNTSIAALGVAAHEAGHAIQYAENYAPVSWRQFLYPVASIGSSAGPYLAIFGLMAQFDILFTVGIIAFALGVLFYLITLPVELNASSRAIAILEEGQYLNSEEIKGAKKVLRAAALTYVASAVTSFVSLLRLILIRNDRRR